MGTSMDLPDKDIRKALSGRVKTEEDEFLIGKYLNARNSFARSGIRSGLMGIGFVMMIAGFIVRFFYELDWTVAIIGVIMLFIGLTIELAKENRLESARKRLIDQLKIPPGQVRVLGI